ncbi:MAG TPA: hypothetical protein VG650_17205 [Mycobacteriales bacterium]|nr:hypothetical protein [Mycobacteriales bacterium]
MQELADVLGRERLLTELMLFKVITLRQLLLAGEARFLSWAAEEVQRTELRLRAIELQRSIEVSRIVEELSLAPESVTLDELVRAAEEPWRSVLAEHRRQLLLLHSELMESARAVRRLAHEGSGAVAALMERLDDIGGHDPSATEGAATYDAKAAWSQPERAGAGWSL